MIESGRVKVDRDEARSRFWLSQLVARPDARARDLGIPFEGTPGPLNAITDVRGVEVGQKTLIEGEGPSEGRRRSGADRCHVIFPRGHADLRPVYGGFFDLNGNGEMTGRAYLEDFGIVQGPIGISDTNAVGQVYAGIQQWSASASGQRPGPSLPKPGAAISTTSKVFTSLPIPRCCARCGQAGPGRGRQCRRRDRHGLLRL